MSGTWRRKGQVSDSANCITWYGTLEVPPTIDINVYEAGTAINPYTAGCFECPKGIHSQDDTDASCQPKGQYCGPLFTGFIDAVKNLQGTDSTFLAQPFLTEIPAASEIEVMGDFGDTAFSPNDPM